MRFVMGVVIGCSIIGLLWILLIIGQVGCPTPSSRWVYEVIQKKVRIAQQTPSPKVVISGGSNVLFGVDSTMLAQYFGRPVVNMGVNAALQVPVILETTKLVLQAGDTLFLALEYPDLYEYDGKPNFQEIDYILARAPWILQSLSWKEKIYLIWETPFLRVLQGYKCDEGKPVRAGPYGAHRINLLGDETLTWPVPNAYRNAVKKSKPKPFVSVESLEYKRVWVILRRFKQWCHQHGIRFFLIPAVIRDFPDYHKDRAIAFLNALPHIASHYGLIFLGEPKDFMYGIDDLYNTPYHLNARGRIVHTKRLIDLFQQNGIR